MVAGVSLGGLIGILLESRPQEPDPRWGPPLAGQLLDQMQFGHRATVDCSQGEWAGYLNPDFDYQPEYLAQPLTVQVNATAAPNLNWTFIGAEAHRLFGVNLTVGAQGVPVLFMPRPAGVDEVTGGRLNHDQLYVQDNTGHLAYRQHSFYQIEVYPTGDEERFFLHEFGHSLGLGHIDRDGQIMAHRSDRMQYRIHECHADWLQHLAPTTWRHTWP